MTDFEKLGVFYLGRRYDSETLTPTDEALLYKSKDLTTHAVCVGMTGSGKTGLGIGIIEEAAIDGIPTLIIDPKGDMGNLLLTFPELSAADFRPWVDEDEAARKQIPADQFAAQTAETWRKGLAAWGQDGDRIARLRASAEFSIYTPGSPTGRPLSILSSLAAPPPELANDPTAMRDRVSAAVSGLLALIGIDADPIQSREHILLANLVDREWRAGRDLTLVNLIHAVQDPGLDRIGAFPLDAFFPTKDRFALAIKLNNLAASPGFSSWTEGEPLDIQRLLYTPAGKPRVSILSISHLNDAERMFFVTVFLNEVLAWTRRQTGTSALRALLYMDEIFGYFPPTSNPPAKTAMLTLLKQARAYGLGIVLATQNPVDLDYRGLSNTGTWFIGRLQTERDKARVIEGLTSATDGDGLDRGTLARLMANLGSRVFLMRNVHDDAPLLFETRWCMSYLRGPLSPAQIGALMAGQKAAAPAPAPAPYVQATPPEPTPTLAPVAPPAPAAPPPAAATKTILPPALAQVYLRSPGAAAHPPAYRPALLAAARIHYVDLRQKLDSWQTVRYIVRPDAQGNISWVNAEPAPEEDTYPPRTDWAHDNVPPALADPKLYTQYTRDFKAFITETQTLELPSLPAHKLVAAPDESEGDFRIRASQLLREHRDAQLEALQKKMAAKFATLEERERRAAATVESKKAQLSRQHMSTAINFGAAAMSVLLGRKMGGLGRATTGIGSISRSGKGKLDIKQAGETLEAVRRSRAELEAEIERETERIREAYDPANLDITTTRVAPRRSDTTIQQMALAWIP
ncbi:MAG: ATP-binding protein [Lentisphaerae bacterium]|nr:ATP-binding protein [Lentisphaerota bacterium]